MQAILRPVALIAAGLTLSASLQGCFLAAGAAAGAAGGYEAKKHGYDVQSPVRKDSAGGYKGQAPIEKHRRDNPNAASTPRTGRADTDNNRNSANNNNNAGRDNNNGADANRNGTTHPYSNGYNNGATTNGG